MKDFSVINNNLAARFINFCLAVSALFILAINIYKYDINIVVFVSVAPVVILACWLLSKLKLKPLHFMILIFVLAFSAKFIFAMVIDSKPISDFKLFYNAAKMALVGDYSFKAWPYFSVWGNQTGIVLFYTGVMKFLGTSLTSLRLINCLFMAGTNLLVYLLAREYASEKAARLSAWLYLAYPAPYLLSPVLTNQHSADFLLLFSLWLFVKKGPKKYSYVILAGFLAALGNAIRQVGIIPVASVFVFTVFAVLQSFRDRKRIFEFAKNGITYIAIFIISGFLMSKGVALLGVHPQGLTNTFPLWKFVVGFNQDTKGEFSKKDEALLMYNKNIAERDRVAKQLIMERLSVGPQKLIKLALTKEFNMWVKEDNTGFTFPEKPDKIKLLGREFRSDTLIRYGLQAEKTVYIIAFALMFLGSVCYFKQKEASSMLLLLQLCFLAYFGSHMLIEVQPRYRYFAMIAVFSLASLGIDRLLALIKGKSEKAKQKQK